MRSIKRTIVVLVVALVFAFSASSVPAATLKVEDGQYKLPASIDPSVTTVMKTELWAHVWRPNTGGPYPIVLFLHGNHPTCGRFDTELGVRIDDRVDYTTTGKCPSGYVVTPNHLGYAYLARTLAAYGYVVVSINANRGINGAESEIDDYGLNLRRGRLVLRHLQKLAKWNASGGAPASLGFQLTGLIDFSQVGLMGHSRGGEGMRAAVAQFNDPDSPWPKRIGPLTFRSLFEIGPVDGQTSRTLNPVDLVWNVLLPGCDGDVSNLQGIRPFDRMLQNTTEAQSLNKSTFQVFGANHNFYNTEWQISDAMGCLGQTPIFPQLAGSPSQRRTALKTLIPFFRSNLGAAPKASLARRFDPSYPVPAGLASETSYARGFTRSPRTSENFVIDNFDQPTGTSSRNVANQSSGLSHYEHGQASANEDPTQRAAAVDWPKAGGFLQVNAAAIGQGLDVNGYHALEFRVMLRCFDTLCTSLPDPTGDVDFSISLADANATLSEPITLKSLAVVRRPGGSFDSGSFSYNQLFQTVRIPLSAFAGADLSHFGGVRFTFDRDQKASIYLANVRLTKALAGSAVFARAMETQAWTETMVQTDALGEAQPELNGIVAIRHVVGVTAAASETTRTPTVEIEVASTRLFPVSGALATLIVGEKTFKLSHYPSGATDRLVFTLEATDFEAISQGAEVNVRVGGQRPWKFGPLDKALAR
jgi:hypothetical protein